MDQQRESTHRDIEVALGRLEERIHGMDNRRRDRDGVLDERYTQTRADIAVLQVQLTEIKGLLDQGRGGWKVIAIASGFVGAIGALVGPAVMKKFIGGGG